MSVAESRRGYLKDGGKRHQMIKKCVRCNHDYVDLLPSNDTLHQSYSEKLKEYSDIKEQLEKHEKDPLHPLPFDKNNHVVKKLPRKPVPSQPIICCHCIEMQWSEYSSTCPLNCNGDASCTIYNCAYNFCWPVASTADVKAEMNLQAKKDHHVDYDSSRDNSNSWFNAAHKAGTLAAVTARNGLLLDRKSCKNDSSDRQIAAYETDAMDFGIAQFMLSNPPSRHVHQDIARHVQALEHPLGPTFIRDSRGVDVNLRPNAAKQRHRNNRLESSVDIVNIDDNNCVEVMDDCCVEVSSKLSSCAESDITEGERIDRVKRLKKKAMDDVRFGSPETKQVSKKVFETYQEMGRSRSKYEDKIEMVTMYANYDENSKGFKSLEYHTSFKDLEKE